MLTDSPQIDVRALAGVLWKWRWLVLACVLAGAGVGLVDLLTRQPVYRATTKLLIERQGPRLLKFQGGDGWVLGHDVPYDTHARLIRTTPIAQRVLEGSRIGEHPALEGIDSAQRKADALLGGLQTDPAREEPWLVHISYTSPNPQLAAEVANAFARAYIADRIETRLGMSKNVNEWLDTRLAEQKERLTESEQRLQGFREEHGFLGPGEPGVRSSRITELENKAAGIKRRARELERRRQQLRKHRETPEEAASVAEVADSELFRQLSARREELLMEQANAASRLGPKHPRMRKISSQLEAISRRLTEEIDRIDRSLTLQIRRLSDDRRSLLAEIERGTHAALESTRLATEYAALQREVELNQQIYDNLLRRLKTLGLASDAERVNLSIVEPARAPAQPYGRSRMRFLLMATATALLLGIGGAFALEQLDVTVKTPEQLEADLGLPVLGVVPALPFAANRPVVLVGAPSVFTDAFSAIRSALFLSSPESPPQTLLITSPSASEGKSTTAAYLAASMAADGVRTLLIDADLRRPVLHEAFGSEPEPGLTDLLASRDPLAPAVQKTAAPGLFLLPAGPPPPNPSELLGSARMRALIEEAARSFGRIIIDSPPLFGVGDTLALADPTVLAAACDGVVLAVQTRRTNRRAAMRARSRLATLQARMIGTVMTQWQETRAYYGAYDNRYGFQSKSEPELAAGARRAQGGGKG